MLPPDTPGPVDRLLQGLQGLVLQLHAISGDLPAGEPARAALERWLLSADQLIKRACADGEAESRRGAVGAVATLMGLAALDAPAGGRAPALRLRVQVEAAPSPLRPGLQQALNQLACDQARRACAEAGATQVLVQLQASRDGLLLRVRDNGRWSAGLNAAPGALALRGGARRLGAQLRIWHWPRRGGEWLLRLPASGAYRDDASSGSAEAAGSGGGTFRAA